LELVNNSISINQKIKSRVAVGPRFFYIMNMIIDKLEKDYDEFMNVATKLLERNKTSFYDFISDYSKQNNISLIINTTKRYDIANFNFSLKMEYIFEFPSVDMPIELSSCNDCKKIEFEYQTDFLHTDRNKILDDFKKIVPVWNEIKTAENRDLALKKLDMLVRSYKMNEDFQ
jgi:hypothetical protein